MAFYAQTSARAYVREPLASYTTGDRIGKSLSLCSLYFRLMTIPDSQDCRHLSPVFFGYDLVKKPRSRAGALPEDELPEREDFVTHRKGKPCPVCLVGKPGLLPLLFSLFSLLLLLLVVLVLEGFSSTCSSPPPNGTRKRAGMLSMTGAGCSWMQFPLPATRRTCASRLDRFEPALLATRGGPPPQAVGILRPRRWGCEVCLQTHTTSMIMTTPLVAGKQCP